MRKHEIDEFPGMSESQAWEAVYAVTKREQKPRSSVSICFTGFTASAAEIMKATATSLGFAVNASVAKSTTHLCCGDNAGPKKVETARKQGVRIITEAEFHHMMESGEIL